MTEQRERATWEARKCSCCGDYENTRANGTKLHKDYRGPDDLLCSPCLEHERSERQVANFATNDERRFELDERRLALDEKRFDLEVEYRREALKQQQDLLTGRNNDNETADDPA